MIRIALFGLLAFVHLNAEAAEVYINYWNEATNCPSGATYDKVDSAKVVVGDCIETIMGQTDDRYFKVVLDGSTYTVNGYSDNTCTTALSKSAYDTGGSGGSSNPPMVTSAISLDSCQTYPSGYTGKTSWQLSKTRATPSTGTNAKSCNCPCNAAGCTTISLFGYASSGCPAACPDDLGATNNAAGIPKLGVTMVILIAMVAYYT